MLQRDEGLFRKDQKTNKYGDNQTYKRTNIHVETQTHQQKHTDTERLTKKTEKTH